MKQRNHLQAYFQQLHPDWQGIKVGKLLKMPAGWECDLYAFNLSYQLDGKDYSKDLVLRVYPGNDAGDKSRHEFNGMQLLYEAGYPVPRVYGIESQPSPSGKAFMIMEYIQGEVMGDILFQSTSQRQASLLTQLCELFVRLHNLDWRRFASNPQQIVEGGKYYFIDDWIMNARRGLEAYKKYEFKPFLDWVIQHRDGIQTDRPSVVHRDFHPNNVLVAPDGSAVVIDWSGWQVSDYRFDLAWTLMLAYAYNDEEMRRKILISYESAANERVAHIEVFEVCACLRRLFDVLTSLSLGAENQGMRPEAVELMRSQMDHLQRVNELLHMHTEIHLAEVDSFLSI